MFGITLIFYYLNANFDKSTFRLYFLQISFMFANFQDNQRSITMSLINV